MGLASLTLLVFLRDWKVTVIAALTVPAVLAASLLLLYAFNMSLNIRTLGGIATAVGLIIDDAIVMIEQIVRRLREREVETFVATVQCAATEFTRPLLASSTATIVIFAPLAFLIGVTGAFFKALSFTMATSLIVSFFVAWLIVPILSARMLRGDEHVSESGGVLTKHVKRVYEKLMRRLLLCPGLCIVLILPLIVAGWLGLRNGETGFMPVSAFAQVANGLLGSSGPLHVAGAFGHWFLASLTAAGAITFGSILAGRARSGGRDPIGDSISFGSAIASYVDRCDRNGWRIDVLGCERTTLRRIASWGFGRSTSATRR